MCLKISHLQVCLFPKLSAKLGVLLVAQYPQCLRPLQFNNEVLVPVWLYAFRHLGLHFPEEVAIGVHFKAHIHIW